MRLRSCTALLLVSFAVTSSADAATLVVDSGGILTGARSVNVDGNFYDVQFVEGTCATLFDGCDSVNDFDFMTEAAALAASQALLEQVFRDTAQGDFDSDAGLTFGCINTTFGVCEALTPFGFGELDGGGPGVLVGAAQNNSSPSPDSVFARVDVFDTNSADVEELVFARWTPTVATEVPEPSTLSLLGVVLAGMATRRRSRKESVGVTQEAVVAPLSQK